MPRKIKSKILHPAVYSSLHTFHHLMDRLGLTAPGFGSAEKVISEKYRFICVTVPLSGRSSLLQYFRQNFNKADYFISHKSLVELFSKKPDYKQYYIFSVIRDPWSRVVSGYNKRILNAINFKRQYFISKYPGVRPDISFRELVLWLGSAGGSDAIVDKHWKSPHQFFLDKNGKMVCNYVARLEKVDRELETIFGEMDLPFPGPLMKKSTSRKLLVQPLHQNHGDYYDEETKGVIAERYREYIAAFGFEYPYN